MKRKPNKKQHQRQQCVERCQQMSTPLGRKGKGTWKGAGVGVGKLLLAITKEIYRYYTAWLHNNTNTRTQRGTSWASKKQKAKIKKKQRGSKTICILLSEFLCVCVRTCIWGRVNSPFLVLLLFHISRSAVLLLFARL